MSYYYHTNDPDAQLCYPHYSDNAFRPGGAGTVIYGAAPKPGTARGEYADRMREWDYQRADTAWAAAIAECGETRTARRIESYIRHYYGRPVRLLCIIAGTRPDNWYSWFFYQWEEVAA